MNKGTIAAVLVALLGVVGSVLPWFRFGARTAISGLDQDGPVTLVIFIVVVTLQLITLAKLGDLAVRLVRMGTMTCAATLLGFAWSNMMRLFVVKTVCAPNMSDEERIISYSLQVGEGLVLVLVAAVVLLIVNQWDSSKGAKEAV